MKNNQGIGDLVPRGHHSPESGWNGHRSLVSILFAGCEMQILSLMSDLQGRSEDVGLKAGR